MFTGIIQAIGSIKLLQAQGEDVRLCVQTNNLDLGDVQTGDSIAVNGVCLTAVELPGDGFCADVSGETLRHTTIGTLQQGHKVNLEKALTPTTRLGGHLVSGHVDGVGEVISRTTDGRSVQFVMRAENNLARYIAQKGSICVDGISLTVNNVNGAEFTLNIVPHTLQETTMDGFKMGSKVNLEVDIIARYLERLIQGDDAAKADSTGINLDTLKHYGFIK